MDHSSANLLLCPICGQSLSPETGAMRCPGGHSFDVAREGYVNLLRSGKNGEFIGDDKISARCRRDFLNKGYYQILQAHLLSRFQGCSGTLLDICCGEGYYTAALGQQPGVQAYGFDISKEMIRLAAKRGHATYFVANLARIPVPDASFDYAVHLFAPFQETEFSRILKRTGRLVSVVPGSRHLYGLKQILYNTPYLNDEKLPETTGLKLCSRVKLSSQIRLTSQEDIDALFRMTPYYFRTSAADKEKLQHLEELCTDVEFVVDEYIKE